MRLKTSTPHVLRALPTETPVVRHRLHRLKSCGSPLFSFLDERSQYLLFVFVQRGLQQTERVHQTRGEAALLSRSSSERLGLGHGPVQVELLLGLFADQLSLSEVRRKTFSNASVLLKTSTAAAPCHLADESGDEQKHQDAVVISAVTEEGVRHEGGEERHLLVELSHLHFPQLHLDGLQDTGRSESPRTPRRRRRRNTPRRAPSPWRKPWSPQT